MPKPVIYFIRHGQTEWNALGRFQGAKDIPLNDLGREQASHAGTVLRDLLARDNRNTTDLAFVASPLGRARHTMELVRAQLAVPHDDYALDDRLREIVYGDWEGLTLAEQEAAHPDLFAARLADKWTLPAPGGESYVEVQERVRAWASELTGDVVAVSHGGTCRALMVALGMDTPDGVSELPIQQGAVYVFSESGLEKFS
ncbi:MAG: histidine phosphatase family protein [Hyphomicrobiales bacterium]|jgi:probable phosphoglycerate mutase|nr:histidine phosphatase family protein [Hyphomicrobiales bacterium]